MTGSCLVITRIISVLFQLSRMDYEVPCSFLSNVRFQLFVLSGSSLIVFFLDS